jgi:tetratricopeptide (TPR) repeat protein
METIIEERPDSVFNVLQAIDTDELIGDEERAKHALLLSMAMDKNYIDRTDFEVLQPAIDYYEDNGSATDKLRTYYYQGRIYQNAGNNALAMECFVNALDKGVESNDNLTKARILVAQSTIYYSLYELDNFIETSIRAASYFKQEEKYSSYANCLIKIINGYTLKDRPEDALPYIDECKQMLGAVNANSLKDFYSAYLVFVTNYGTVREISDLIIEYDNIIPDTHKDWLTLSKAYLRIDRYEDALQATEQYKNNSDTSEELKYKALVSMIYEKLGKQGEALSAYKEYMTAFDVQNNAILQQDTKFVEERHNLEMAKAKETEAKNRLTIIVLGCAVALMASLYIINLIRKRLKKSRVENAQLLSEKALYEQMYNEVVAERDALNEMIVNNTIKEEAMDVIKKRLGVLNTIIVSHLSAKDTDIKRANEELEHLIANRNDFIKSTRLTLEENYPHFFAYLKDKGLEEFEIDFCCLYAIGLKGKEIKAYTNLTRHYKDSSEVRQKLGLSESDTNLSNFLQKLLKKEGE